MTWRAICRGVARLRIAFFDAALNAFIGAIFDSTEICGVRIVGRQEDFRAIRPALEIVRHFGQARCGGFRKLRAGLFAGLARLQTSADGEHI